MAIEGSLEILQAFCVNVHTRAALLHSEKGLVKSTTHNQLSTISSHQTIFISIKDGVVCFIKVT